MIDKEKKFQEIKAFVLKWYDQSQNYLNNNYINSNIIRNQDNGLVINFENNQGIAEIVVEKATYAPYEFISFEIAVFENNQAKISYSWYDTVDTPINEINKELDRGINNLIKLSN